MDVKGMEVYYASDLKDYGPTEDGTPFVGEVFRVYVENQRGDRWAHGAHFHGVKLQVHEEGVSYMDIRPAARAACQLLVDRIVAAGWVDMTYWSEARPVYGSDAYVQYGQYEDLLTEKMEG